MIVVKTLFCEVQAVCQQKIQYARVMLSMYLEKPAYTCEAVAISSSSGPYGILVNSYIINPYWMIQDVIIFFFF